MILLKPLHYISLLILYFKSLNPLNCYWYQFLQICGKNIFLHMVLHTNTHAQTGDDVRQET